MKKLLVLAGLLLGQIAIAQVQPETKTGSMVVGAPSGGNQGTGSVNMQACYINGVACGTAGGSGTVNSGSANQIAYYAANGTTVSGTSTLSVTSLTGQVSPANGGTGEAGLITGIAKANGTSAYTAAAAADVYGLFSGTCSTTTFLRGDGTCAVPAGTAASANPTGTIGLTAVNGVASTFMASDSAPALSQAITPTWTMLHTFNAGLVSGSIILGGATTSAPAWLTNGIGLSGIATTYTDTTSTGSPGRIAIYALPASTVAATNTITPTYLETLYIPAPIAGANVTPGTLVSLETAGVLKSSGGILFSGAVASINVSSNFATNIGTGSTATAVTLGGGSNSINFGSDIRVGANLLILHTAPTITSGLGTATVTATNSAAFEITISSGTPTTTTVLAMPNATTGWACTAQDISSAFTARESAYATNSVTFTWSTAPANTDKLVFNCGAF